MKIRGFVRPSASVHRSRGSYALLSAVSTARYKEKEEGFPKGGTWVHLFGSEKTNQTRTDCPNNNIKNIYRRAAKIYSRTTERAQARDYANRQGRHSAAAPLKLVYAQPSECKRATTRTWVQRHAASVRARTSVTLPECKNIVGKTFILSICDDRSR